MFRIAPRHGRFVIAFGLGALGALGAWWQGISPVFSLLFGANAFFLLYLALMLLMTRKADPAQLRKHAEEADEGVLLILILALLAVVVSATAIFLVLNDADNTLPARLAAIVSIPLGWSTIHVLAAFHYAHRYYQDGHRGLGFPGKGDPDGWDFHYFSFNIGMTAQVSDVQVESPEMRRRVMLHSVVSFFYNTGILALAVNAVVTAAG